MTAAIMAMGTQTQRGDANEDAPNQTVLPREAEQIQHFCMLYAEFCDALSHNLPAEPFNTDQKIALYGMYAGYWGQKK